MRFSLLFLALFSTLSAQETPGGDWGTRAIQLKFLDPEQLREVFAGRSFVMQVNRDLKLLTVSGPIPFLNEVEQMGKHMDVLPPAAADIEFTFYLLASDAAQPFAAGLPPAIQSALTALSPKPPAGLGLVDLKTIRVGDRQPGEVGLGTAGSTGAAFGRVTFQSATAIQGTRKETVRLSGLHIWISQPQQTQSSTPGADSDFASNLDLKDGQPELVVRSGVSKPVIVFVEASVKR